MSLAGARFDLLAFLIERGASRRDHSGSTLLSHLHGTRRLLLGWGAPVALCDAGLFHSVYGTESYSLPLVGLDERDILRGLLGDEAEMIAYDFCAATRASLRAALEAGGTHGLHDRFTGDRIDASDSLLRSLCTLTAANWLEQWPRLPDDLRGCWLTESAAASRLLLPAASREFRAALAGASESPGQADDRGLRRQSVTPGS